MSTFIIKFLTGTDDLKEAIINEQTEEAAKLEFYLKHTDARILSINGKAISCRAREIIAYLENPIFPN